VDITLGRLFPSGDRFKRSVSREACIRECSKRVVFGRVEGLLRAVVSTDRPNTCIETLCGSFVSQRLSRSLIELPCDGAQLCLAMYRKIRALWKVLPKKAVGVFVRTAVPCIAHQAIAKQSAERGL
jgi:hypothetical protein